MLTPSCDLLPSTSFSSLIIDFAYQREHLLPLDPGMSDAEALTFADFGFPDEESVQQAKDAWFVGRQVEETKPVARRANSQSIAETVDVASTTKTSGEKSAAGSGCGYTVFRAANPDPDGKKKKGRPVGWKKAVHMRPKTEVPNKPVPTTVASFELSETKNDGEDEIKVKTSPAPAPDAPLSSDSDIQQMKQKPTSVVAAPASTGYAAFRAANPGTKKLGRPVGWKMGANAKGKRIEKNRKKGKGGKKLAGPINASRALPSIEIKGEEEGMSSSFDQQDGEVSMQLDQQQNGEEALFQLKLPIYDIDDEKQECTGNDEDFHLPASFWESVLAAANAPKPSGSATKQEDYIKPDTQRGSRDSAVGSVHSRAAPFVSVKHDNTDETTQDDESGSSDMSHFSA